MDKIIHVINSDDFLEKIKKEAYRITEKSVLANLDFLINPSEDTLQTSLKRKKSLKLSDEADDIAFTILVSLMGASSLHPGFIQRCIRLAFETEDSWDPHPYTLHADSCYPLIKTMWASRKYRFHFNHIINILNNLKNRSVETDRLHRKYKMHFEYMKNALVKGTVSQF